MSMLKLAATIPGKSKTATVPLFVLIMLAALLMDIGLVSWSAAETFYEDKAAELHDAHVSITMTRAGVKEPYAEYLRSYPGVIKTEAEPVILLPAAAFRYDKTDFSIRAALLNADQDRVVAPLKLVEGPLARQGPVGAKDIYLPYGLKSGGYRLGDSFTLILPNKSYTYRVGGFFESSLMGTTKLGMLKFYLPDAAYRRLSTDLGTAAEGVLLSAILADGKKSGRIISDYYRHFPQVNTSQDPLYWGGDLEAADSSTLTVKIVAMLLNAFAAVIALVTVLVIRFRITGNMEDGIENLGVLKALGYTNYQILSSMVMHYLLITAAASLLGVAVSYALLPVFGWIITYLTGLLWPSQLHLGINLVSVLVVNFLVMAVAICSSLRVRRLTPVTALRGGIMPHHFRRNRLPLNRARGGLQFVLACKSMLADMRQNLLIAGIIGAITMSSVISVVLYFNIAEDRTAFFKLAGAETPDIGLQVQPGQDSFSLLEQIRHMPGVGKAFILDTHTVAIEGQLVTVDFTGHYAQLDNPTVYEGRYPQYDNEIVLTGGLARRLGKSVGDTVQAAVGDISFPFLITGLNQSLHTAKTGASLTTTGMQQLIPGHRGMSINVYLDGIGRGGFIRSVQAKHGAMIQSVTDVQASLETQSRGYLSAIFAVMTVVLAITAAVVAIILYLLTKRAILKRKRELGILKATGYTTSQLMTQIALGFVPVVTSGVAVGGVLGSVCTNSVLKLLFFDSGVSNAHFVVPLPLILLLGLILIGLAYAVSMLVSRRIRKITPYEWIRE